MVEPARRMEKGSRHRVGSVLAAGQNQERSTAASKSASAHIYLTYSKARAIARRRADRIRGGNPAIRLRDFPEVSGFPYPYDRSFLPTNSLPGDRHEKVPCIEIDRRCLARNPHARWLQL